MNRAAGQSPEPTALLSLEAAAKASVPVDRIYGVMAASGIEIEPLAGEELSRAWQM